MKLLSRVCFSFLLSPMCHLKSLRGQINTSQDNRSSLTEMYRCVCIYTVCVYAFPQSIEVCFVDEVIITFPTTVS